MQLTISSAQALASSGDSTLIVTFDAPEGQKAPQLALRNFAIMPGFDPDEDLKPGTVMELTFTARGD